MARSILDIIVKLSKQGNADREVVKGLIQVKSKFAEVAMNAAVVTGALYTAKKAFDFTKEGAQLQFVEDRFNRLGSTIGVNSSLLGDLRDVTRGLYSDTELMTSASDLMGLGLAKNSEELERMMRVSSGLNQDMNQLVLTLTNMTTMRFDQLNMSVDGFKEKVQELEDAGMSAEAAFKEAFLQQGEKQLARVGEAADSAIGPMMQFEASVKNIKDELLKMLSVEAGPFFAWLGEGLNRLAYAMTVEGDLVQAAKTGAITMQEANAQINKFTYTAYEAADAAEWLAERTRTYGPPTFEEFSGAVADTSGELDEFMSVLDMTNAAIGGPIKKAQEDYRDTLSDIESELADLEIQLASTKEGSEKYNEIAGKISEKEQAIRDVTAAYKEQGDQIMFNIGKEQILASSLTADQQAEAIAVLGQSLGLYDQQTADAYTTTAAWVKQLADGAITTEQFAEYMDMTSDSMFNMSNTAEEAAAGGLSKANDEIHDGAVKAFGYKEQIEAIRNQLDNLDGMHAHADVTISVNGSIPSMANLSNAANINYGAMGMSGGGLGAWTEYLAEGGALTGNTAVVGEKGFEVLAQDSYGRWKVIPHDASRTLADLGLLGDARKLVEGGPLPGQFLHPVTGNVLNVTGSSGGSKKKKNNNTTTTTIVTPTETTSTTATVKDSLLDAVAVPLVTVTEQAVQSVAAAQVQQAIEGRQTRAQAAAQSAQLAGLLQANNQLLQRMNRTLPTAIQAAVQQRP